MNSIKKNIRCFFLCLLIAPVLAMRPAPVTTAVNQSDEILQKALKAEIYKVPHFYANASDKALSDLVYISSKTLSDSKLLKSYSLTFKKTPVEIEKIIVKIIKKARARLKFNAAKDLRLQAQGKDAQLTAKTTYAKKIIAPTSEKDIQNCWFYIMLDVPDFNTSGNSIDWKGVINNLTSQILGAEFIPVDYRHITLAWHKFKQPLNKAIREKLERAFDRAKEELKILYPNGIQNIALLDGAYILGENGVVFGVATNPDLIKIIKIISESLSRENLTEFEFPEEKLPLHVTLGRIIPVKKAYDFKDQIRTLNAPSGARISQGESFASDIFRTSCTLPKNVYLSLGNYKF